MSARGLRIAYICPRPSLNGGIKSTRLICEALVRRGHDVSIIFPVHGAPLPPLWRPRNLFRTIRSRWRNAGSRSEHHLRQSKARLIPVKGRVVRSEDCPDADITIASWWECVEWIKTWPAAKGTKVHYARGYEVYLRQKDRIEAVYRSDIPKITNSRWLQEILRREYGQDSTVIQNGVDWNQFRVPPRPRNEPPVVGFVYAAGPVKGCETAFQACREVQQRVPDLRVVSFGAARLQRCGELPKHTEYFCRPAQERIAGIYASADCWLVPSVSEGFSMPGLEASACRCPVVATRCGGVTEFIRDGVNGYLVPIGDWQAMAERIHSVLTMPTERWAAMSVAAFQVAREFDWDRSAALLEEFLVGLLQKEVVGIS